MWSISSICILRMCHAMVTGTDINMAAVEIVLLNDQRISQSELLLSIILELQLQIVGIICEQTYFLDF